MFRAWYSRHRLVLVVMRVFVLIHVCGYLVSAYTGIDRFIVVLVVCGFMALGAWVDVRYPSTRISVIRSPVIRSPALWSELERLRRERVELLGLIDNCFYHIAMNESYISDPMTGVLWMRYDRLKKLDREIELKELDLCLVSEMGVR